MNRAETLAQHKDRMRAQFAVGPKWCAACRCKKPRQGGKDITYNNGRNFRWICAECS